MNKLTRKEMITELIFCPDDNGWYWQRDIDWKVSQLFKTRENACQAKDVDVLSWLTPRSLVGRNRKRCKVLNVMKGKKTLGTVIMVLLCLVVVILMVSFMDSKKYDFAKEDMVSVISTIEGFFWTILFRACASIVLFFIGGGLFIGVVFVVCKVWDEIVEVMDNRPPWYR